MQKIYSLNLNKSQKLLLYVLRELNADSEPVPATLEKLADIANMNRLTVNKSLKELKEMNYITVGGGKGKAPNNYKVNLP